MIEPLYRVVATAGKFDALYPRDITFLKYARTLGDELVVFIYNDYRIEHCPSVLSIVGKNEYNRIQQMEAFDFVDVVLLSQHGREFRYEPFTKYVLETDFSVGYELEQLKPHLFITSSMETFNFNKTHCADMHIEIKFADLGEYENYGNEEK